MYTGHPLSLGINEYHAFRGMVLFWCLCKACFHEQISVFYYQYSFPIVKGVIVHVYNASGQWC